MSKPTVTVWHDPASLESQRALGHLRELGFPIDLVDLSVRGPDEAAIRAMLARLGQPAAALVRPGQPRYVELGLERLDVTDDEIVRALAAHPTLLRRPVVALEDRAVIARPAERALALFVPKAPAERVPGMPFGI